MPENIFALLQEQPVYLNVYIAVFRWVAPVLAFILLLRCCAPLLSFRKEPEVWAFLHLPDGRKEPVIHWENVIGHSKKSDIVLEYPTVSKTHGVLTRYGDGTWTIADSDSSTGIRVNGKKIKMRALQPDDVITIGEVEATLHPVSRDEETQREKLRTNAVAPFTSVGNLILLSVLQILACLAFLLQSNENTAMPILTGFSGIMIAQWLLLAFYMIIRRTAFEVETIAFFLCTLGMAMIATVKPTETVKQMIAMFVGIAGFLFVGWSLRDLNRAKTIRMIAAVAGVLFLVITLVFGKEYYGAKNWLIIAGTSIQPSELTKVCFVFVGASSLELIITKRNLILFIGYSMLICGFLALMNDFGAALIFFCTFLVIAFLRSGNVGTLGLAITSLGFAGVVVLKIAPHALRRFSTWRHIWEMPLDGGYQQVKALICMASGGLLGLGPGCGWMKNVFAADSDVAVATLTEEWGLLVFIMAILCIVAQAVFCVRSAAMGRNSFYTIGACAAVTILLVQVILNALGTVDVLPLTGVTFPFLSNGGSSMICAWCLLAFIKAADTRQNASFAIKREKPGKGGAE